MAVRNCKEIGENLQKIMTRLMANDDLVKLLYYTNTDPLSQAALTDEQKRQYIFNDLIKIVPKSLDREDGRSVIVLYVSNGVKLSNNEFRNVSIVVDVFVPLDNWIIKDSNLRPFAILGNIQESLEGKTVNGLGKIEGGDFELTMMTEESSCYEATYQITTYA